MALDLHLPVDPNKTFDEMNSEEKLRYEHQKLHQEHKGHETMHMEMVAILLITMILAQVILVEWKRRHQKSYSLVTMIAVWSIPAIVCIRNQWWRFIIVWILFSLITGFIGKKALQKPVNGTTPRLVYKWFYFLYKLSCVFGVIGYIIILLTFMGVNLIFDSKPHVWMDSALMFIFYGLYYGVLGRDISEICAERMASHIGYYMPQGMPTRHLDNNVCAVCGNQLLVTAGEEGLIENTYKLSCGHTFHEFCIRGWCIIGKKQTCPYCKEKVDLKRMFKNPWDRPHVLYGQFLDWVRLLVAWQPLILFVVQVINWLLGLH